MTKDILQDACLAGDITVNKYIMRELGVNAALLYATLVGEYASVKGGKDTTLRTIFEQLAADAHLSLHDMVQAVETLERAGFVEKNGDEVRVYVPYEDKGGNADE